MRTDSFLLSGIGENNRKNPQTSSTLPVYSNVLFCRFIRHSHHHNDITMFVMITMAIEVFMLLHLGIAVILLMNPVFLHVEEVVGAPRSKFFCLVYHLRCCIYSIFCLGAESNLWIGKTCSGAS